MHKQIKAKLVIASLISVAVLAACGGGGSGSSAQTVSLSGVVADGYLSGVKVCLDTNQNSVCDPGEPYATTNSSGAYTITGANASDVAAYSVVAEVPATAVDADFPSTTVGKPYILSAPKGTTTVTPLSSLVDQAMQATPALSAASAAANVQASLGITSSPLADYIATPNADAHIRAQMIAANLQNNMNAIGGGTSSQKKALQSALLTMAQQAVVATAPAIGASAPANVPVVGVEDFNTVRAVLANKLSSGSATQPVTVNFDVVNGATSVKACDALTLANLQRWDQSPLSATPPAAAIAIANPTTVQNTPGVMTDLRFYISNVLLWDASGNAVPLVMTEDNLTQSKGVALMNFGYNTATLPACTSSGAPFKTTITGNVVPGTYTGISFTLGVPIRSADLSTKLNHSNAADTANTPAPLQSLAMNWSWQSGRKFVKIEFAPTTPAKKFSAGVVGNVTNLLMHLGSTGCGGNPVTGADTACTNPNRLGVQLNNFNASTQKVVLNLATLFAGSDLTYESGGPAGCMSGTTDLECTPIFKAWGIDLPTGVTLTGPAVQTVFSVR